MNRRSFIAGAIALPVALTRVKELAFDVVIIGAGVGGCAAALALSKTGLRVVLTEETDWIGGNLLRKPSRRMSTPGLSRSGRRDSIANIGRRSVTTIAATTR